jgi:hypothetical protein
MDALDVLALKLGVGGKRQGTEAVVLIGFGGGFAEAGERVGGPFGEFFHVETIMAGLRGDIALELAHLRGEHDLGLHLLRLRGVDGALVAVPKMATGWTRRCRPAFRASVVLTLDVRHHGDRGPALVLRELHLIALLLHIEDAGAEVEVLRRRASASSESSAGGGLSVEVLHLQFERMLGFLAQELVELEAGGFELVARQRGLGTERERAGLDDARFQTRRRAGGIALEKHVGERFEAFADFLGRMCLLLRGEHLPGDGAHTRFERGAELLEPSWASSMSFCAMALRSERRPGHSKVCVSCTAQVGPSLTVVGGEIAHAPVADAGHEVGILISPALVLPPCATSICAS